MDILVKLGMAFVALLPTMFGALTLHFCYILKDPEKRSWFDLYFSFVFFTIGVYTFLLYKRYF